MHRFEVFEDKAGERRWRFVADNNQTIAVCSEGYSSHDALNRSIEICREGSATPTVYEDKSGEFRWRLTAKNGNVIATGGEGYTTKANCEHGLERFLSLCHSADVLQVANV